MATATFALIVAQAYRARHAYVYSHAHARRLMRELRAARAAGRAL